MKESKGLIVLVSQYRFPEGDAGSVRFYNFALSLQRLGYKILVVGLGEVTDGEQEFQGVSYLSLRTPNRYGSYLFYTWRLKKVLTRLKKGRGNIEAIVCGFTMIDVLLFLKSYCRRHGIKLIKDVVEWYSPQQFKRGKMSYAYQMKDIENRVLVAPPVRVIAISRYLERYFISRGCVTGRIPIYFDVAKLPLRVGADDGILRLVYAGSPGKKDYLCFQISLILWKIKRLVLAVRTALADVMKASLALADVLAEKNANAAVKVFLAFFRLCLSGPVCAPVAFFPGIITIKPN